jgi:hypothetical protein
MIAAPALVVLEVGFVVAGVQLVDHYNERRGVMYGVGCACLVVAVGVALAAAYAAYGRRKVLFGAVFASAALVAAGSVLLAASAISNWAQGCYPIGFVCGPPPFRDEAFSGLRWRSESNDDPDNPRGEMYSDLVRRLQPQRTLERGQLVGMLGVPYDRRDGAIYWYAGRWQSIVETCVRASFSARQELRALDLVVFASPTRARYPLNRDPLPCGDRIIADAPSLRVVA